MNFEEALIILQSSFEAKGLNDVQEMVFLYAWQDKTYEEIAEILDYDTDYIRQIGSQLWRSLSNLLEEKVTKKNFRSVLKRYQETNKKQRELNLSLNLDRALNQKNLIELSNLLTISIAFPLSNTNIKTKQQLAQASDTAVIIQKDRLNLDILPTEELLSLLDKVNETYIQYLQDTREIQLQTITLMLSLSFIQ